MSPDHHHHLIAEGVRRLRRRAQSVAFFRALLQVLFYFLLGGALLLIVRPELRPLAVLGAVVACSMVLGALLGLFGRPGAAEAAKLFDDHAGAKDRLSSAVELRGARGPMVRALIEDAAEGSAAISPAEVFPLRLPREGRWLPVPALALVAAVFLPGWLAAEPPVDPAVDALLARQIAGIEEYLSVERDKEPTARRKDLIERLEKLSDQLKRDPVDKKEAMAKIAELMEDLEKGLAEDLERELEMEKLVKNLQQNDRTRELADELNAGSYSDAAAKVQEMLDELKKELERKKAEGLEDLDELEERIQELEEILAKLQNLLNLKLDIDASAQVLAFLGNYEGDLGELPENLRNAKFVKLMDLLPPDHEPGGV